MLIRVICGESVSYTHLDVYKRQAQYSSRNIVLRDGQIKDDTINTQIQNAAEALAALPKQEEEWGIRAVSYTHLLVPKFQLNEKRTKE